MQGFTDNKKFAARIDALIAEEDPAGQASRAFDRIKEDVEAIRANRGDAYQAELKVMMAQAARLKQVAQAMRERGELD